jgi:hypothetical protein
LVIAPRQAVNSPLNLQIKPFKRYRKIVLQSLLSKMQTPGQARKRAHQDNYCFTKRCARNQQ